MHNILTNKTLKSLKSSKATKIRQNTFVEFHLNNK